MIETATEQRQAPPPPEPQVDPWLQADINIHHMKVSGELQRRADHRALLDQIQHGEYR